MSFLIDLINNEPRTLIIVTVGILALALSVSEMRDARREMR